MTFLCSQLVCDVISSENNHHSNLSIFFQIARVNENLFYLKQLLPEPIFVLVFLLFLGELSRCFIPFLVRIKIIQQHSCFLLSNLRQTRTDENIFI